MIEVSAQAFLLPSNLSGPALTSIIARVVDVPAVVPVVFPEGGGDVDMELSVPYRAGMDEVAVDAARLTIEAAAGELSIDGWQVKAGPEGKGVFVLLDVPARLRRLVLEGPAPPAGSFLVVRSTEPGPPLAPGPPLFAGKDFPPGGPMFPPPIPRLTATTAGNRVTVTLPDSPAAAGRAWLLQYATGDEVIELIPADLQTAVTSVTVAPAPTDVRLVLRGGGADQPLWRHPGSLEPGAGRQDADFTPAAGARLAAALAEARAAAPAEARAEARAAAPAAAVSAGVSGADAGTLALPLRFHAASAGTLHVVDRTLDLRYVAYPAGRDPLALALDGDWADLTLTAPVRAIVSSTLRLRAEHQGRELVPGSPEPPIRPPAAGLHVAPGRTVAAPARLPAGTSALALAAVQLLVAPLGHAEFTCRLHADAGGTPGAPLTGPLVARLPAGAARAWVRLDLDPAVRVAVPSALWVSVRTTGGALDWFAAAGGPPARVSGDDGRSWADADAAAGRVGTPWVRLQHAVDPATVTAPVLTVRAGEVALDPMPLAPAGRPGDYAGPTGLPERIARLLAAGTGAPVSETGRRTVTLSLFSAAVLDLTLTELTCSYAPFDET
ncbi:hypothetical protein [Actinomadura sp. HBU206391]|uniref:hypothetical protein n=1 Tax=Actinomadura sp. HBU206391 TaxID=2731692 RepID=UPI001650AF09|nr:hypothetical protein [Actinomadura sp. HBU206391]MBC6462882.1 hypothetical protein [Actinomadura sp. HBU206391]